MDITTTIIGLLLLALFIVPVIFLSKSGKKKKTRLSKDIQSEASRNNLSLTKFDSWNESAIGIDDKNGKVIYIDESHADKDVRIFNLKDVKSFKTFPDLTNKSRQNTDYKKEPKISMGITFRDPSKSDLEITFYVPGFGKLKEEEKLLFEKWSEIIKKSLGL